ncbi:hypothetical protein MFRU_005g04350 [Monilinia fructicola]|nr:hypothetical protein MFRU_005g04350 [Monilinia fructicola]
MKPVELTGAQKAMLLELAWAPIAFMQTFTIPIIDSSITFDVAFQHLHHLYMTGGSENTNMMMNTGN